MFRFLFVVLALAAMASAYTPRPARMTMLFGFGGPKKTTAAAPTKAAPAKSAPANYKVGEGSANKGTYVPEGLTKAQYDKFLAEETAKKAKKAVKFPKGKEPETLTEWLLKEQKKGNVGKGLLYKGHRMVKTKYDDWYTDISPV